MSMQKTYPIIRGAIFYADLEPVKGSEQGKKRPVLILQNDVGNTYAPTTIIAPLTSQLLSMKYPTTVFLEKGVANVPKDSLILLNQIRTIDKSRLTEYIGVLPAAESKYVDEAIKVSLALD